jgi:DNA-binding Xre family transcriptional regulator
MPIIVVLPIARRKCGLTQEKLAQLSDRSAQLIGKLEQGKAKGIGFDTLNQICQVTGRQVCDIIVHVPDDPKQLDDVLVSLSKRLKCSIDEILPYIPQDLTRAYRNSRVL